MGLTYETIVSKIKEYLADNNLENIVNKDYEKKYMEFNNLFSPENLEKLEGKDVRDKLFLHDGEHTLCWHLEYNSIEFGGKGNGGAQNYSLYKGESGKWKTGPSNLREVDDGESIEIAINIRDAIVDGANYISNAHLNSIKDYVNLGKALNEIFKNCPSNPDYTWIHKYYSIIFPKIIPHIHKEELKEDMIKKFGIEPEKDYWAKDGQLVLLAKEAGINLYSLFDKEIVGLFYEVDNDVWDDFKRKKLRYEDRVNYWVFTPGETAKFWDFNKENNIMTMGFKYIGDYSKYPKLKDIKYELKEKTNSKNPSKRAQQIYDFCNNIRINDIIFVKKSSYNNSKLLGYGTVKSDYKYDENLHEEHKSYREVDWEKTGSYDVTKYPFGQYSLINITNDKERIEYYLNLDLEDDTVEKQIHVPEDFKHNIIYFGAPGTGKSHNLNKKAEEFGDHIERVTFHENYSYANFVGTYKPKPNDDKITYKFVPGPFMNVLTKALTSKNEEDYLLIIEEINRANPAAVFGDIFQLLDRNENGESEFPVTASEDMNDYLKDIFGKGKDSEDISYKISIPKNMYIWATMNSADQGVFPMDTAFKRRWDFEYIGINEGESDIKNIKVELPGQKFNWNKLRKAINNRLTKEYHIHEDKCLGPFFAFHDEKYRENGIVPTEEFIDTFKNKVIMYLFEDAARSKRNDLFNSKDYDGWITLSEIYEKFGDENGGEYIKVFHKDIFEDVLKEDDEDE